MQSNPVYKLYTGLKAVDQIVNKFDESIIVNIHQHKLLQFIRVQKVGLLGVYCVLFNVHTSKNVRQR